MTLRFTDPEHLATLPERIRAQIERNLGGSEAARRVASQAVPGARLGRPEQEAGRLLVKWADETPLPGPIVQRYGLANMDPPADRIGHYLHHAANGGWRGGVEAAILQGQGVRAGWPDYTLYLPLGRWAGLVFELKALEGDKPTDEQLAILCRCERVGYRVGVYWGYEDARAGVEAYLAACR